jgi:thiamine-phosphate pyrophosphorylase
VTPSPHPVDHEPKDMVSAANRPELHDRAAPPVGLIVVTDRRRATAPLPEVVAAAVEGGARWVLLREKDLPRAERAELAARLRAVLAPAGGQLIVAGTDPLGADGIHLAASDPLPPLIMDYAYDTPGDSPRRPGGGGVLGRSCHSAQELGQVTVEDYVTLSPVYASRSKPGYGPALGVAGLAELCGVTHAAVFALGGIETAEQAGECRAAGAAGVAVMGAVMRAGDPAAVVAGLMEGVRA